MSELVAVEPRELNLHEGRWKQALAYVQGLCVSGQVPAAALVFSRNGRVSGPHAFGKLRISLDAPAAGPDTIFLIASITKPIVAMGVLRLVEQGLLALDDRVETYLPNFGRAGKHAVTLRHLLTHTSGLPDMVPNNRELRIANAPLSEFVAATCQTPPDFPAGRSVQYQSMGFAILGEIIHQTAGKTCGQFLHDEFFAPLGMTSTALGAPNAWFEGAQPTIRRVAEVRVPEDHAAGTAWNWNSRYWRQLGVPWGGLLSTPLDLAKFAQMMLNEGRIDRLRVLSPAAIRAATRNQLDGLRDLNELDRRTRPWGLGWRLHWPAHSANFGEFLGPQAYGHWGATGTLLWIDPATQSSLTVLTTQPQEPAGQYLSRISNMVLAAML